MVELSEKCWRCGGEVVTKDYDADLDTGWDEVYCPSCTEVIKSVKRS